MNEHHEQIGLTAEQRKALTVDIDRLPPPESIHGPRIVATCLAVGFVVAVVLLVGYIVSL